MGGWERGWWGSVVGWVRRGCEPLSRHLVATLAGTLFQRVVRDVVTSSHTPTPANLLLSIASTTYLTDLLRSTLSFRVLEALVQSILQGNVPHSENGPTTVPEVLVKRLDPAWMVEVNPVDQEKVQDEELGLILEARNELSIATLRLLDALFSTCDRKVMEAFGIVGPEEDSVDADRDEVRKSAVRILSLMALSTEWNGTAESAPPVALYDAVHDGAPNGATPSAIPTTSEVALAPPSVEGFDEYLSDAQTRCEKCVDAVSSDWGGVEWSSRKRRWDRIASDLELATEEPLPCSGDANSFRTALRRLLGSILELPAEQVLLATSLVTLLAAVPHRSVHSLICGKDGILDVIETVAVAARSRSAHVVDFEEKVRNVWSGGVVAYNKQQQSLSIALDPESFVSDIKAWLAMANDKARGFWDQFDTVTEDGTPIQQPSDTSAENAEGLVPSPDVSAEAAQGFVTASMDAAQGLVSASTDAAQGLVTAFSAAKLTVPVTRESTFIPAYATFIEFLKELGAVVLTRAVWSSPVSENTENRAE
ncbi:hypothetical protein M427DRAFT_53298 [Gonapodya prolifera JEL478]|uniref:Uncharacterized protein n=1 Tax=Gonapodya prolifera (strain JEL478) TaxID=1344416 RepID=A0A139APZ8_GONPJ|nr:hypothetical protein M427DRAFT_53298 [Gonapodya prolifera JEL478]|eukprot:KXS18802.1 hypothetical protein M427DRAFT_53298 [Gonapodya prolifera JEL478]